MHIIFLLLLLIRASAEYVSNLNTVIASIFVLLLFVHILNSKRIVARTWDSGNLILCWYIFLFIMFTSALINGTGYGTVARYLSELACFILGNYFIKSKKIAIDQLLNVMLTSSIMPLAYGVYQYITNTGYTYYDMDQIRINSFFSHPSQYSIYLLIIVFISLYNVLYKGKYKKINLLILSLAAVEIMLSYTRIAWIAMFILILLMLKQSKNITTKVIIGFTIAIALAAGSDIILARFASITNTNIETNSLLSRFSIWKTIFTLFLDRFLIGYGPGSSILHIGNMVHNEYLKALFEYGIFGAVAFMTTFIVAIKHLLKNRTEVSYNVLLLLLIMLGVGMTDNVFDSLCVQIYLWSLIGAALGQKYLLNQKG